MRRFVMLALLLPLTGAFSAIGGCAQHPATQAPALNLSDAEARYGESPARSDPSITFQPDVIKIDNGPQAVHGVSSDGLTWTVDANAPHASDIAAGKVVFLTSRAVGRVLSVQRNGDELAIVFGPIAITDLIKEAHISADQPIDLNSMSVYTAPNYPQGPIAQPSPHASLIAQPEYAQTSLLDALFQPALADAAGPLKEVDINDFHARPIIKGGIGIEIWYDKGGVKVNAFEGLKTAGLSVHFILDIHGGFITRAEVELRGVAALVMRFVATSTVGVHGNIHTDPLMLPVDMTIPIVNAPPFQMILHQSFLIKTAFSSRNSVITADGVYTFTGAFVMGYNNGSWRLAAPTDLKAQTNLLNSVGGIALGPESLVMSYNLKAIAGVGAFGFAVGPYMGYTASIGISNAGIVGMIPCRAAVMGIAMNAGVGYALPSFVTGGINIFLRALKLAPIESVNGPSYRANILSKKGSIPGGCAGI